MNLEWKEVTNPNSWCTEWK